MAVKILIKRTLRDGQLKAASLLLNEARKSAMNQPGYIASENWVSMDDPHLLVVSSMWERREDWERWRASSQRQDNERRFAEILTQPAQYEHYALGFPAA
jgi:heme-degrading monooxygenase HmoA